jgi:hypothetical protein
MEEIRMDEDLEAFADTPTEPHGDDAHVDLIQRAFADLLARRLETVPPHIRELLADHDPVMALRWLDSNGDRFVPPGAPQTDAGATGERLAGADLDDSQRRMLAIARKAGYAIDAASLARRVKAMRG